MVGRSTIFERYVKAQMVAKNVTKDLLNPQPTKRCVINATTVDATSAPLKPRELSDDTAGEMYDLGLYCSTDCDFCAGAIFGLCSSIVVYGKTSTFL